MIRQIRELQSFKKFVSTVDLYSHSTWTDRLAVETTTNLYIDIIPNRTFFTSGMMVPLFYVPLRLLNGKCYASSQL